LQPITSCHINSNLSGTELLKQLNQQILV
jgi:hypothetical protein